MLTGKNIYKRYGTVEVLKGVDLTINRGEIVSIVGPSGSGKSTLLHILGTLDKADSGDVRMNETSINTLKETSWQPFATSTLDLFFNFIIYCPSFRHWKMCAYQVGWQEKRSKL
jgi:lipoprotein-releasing system ATP-binding protein